MLEIVVPKHYPPRPNEAAWLLRETNEYVTAKHSRQRFQRIWVLRDDHIQVFTKDLGESSKFTYPELQIPAEWQHTVAELQAIAEEVRTGRQIGEFIEEKSEQSTLLNDWLEQVERRRKVMHNRSVFGPGGKTQRNGFAFEKAFKAGIEERKKR